MAATIGWIAVAVVIMATLSPIDARPHVAGLGVHIERFGAYFIAAAGLAAAYPKRLAILLVGLLVLAFGLEIAQSLEASRHARASDALVKFAGGMCGLLAMAGARYFWTGAIGNRES